MKTILRKLRIHCYILRSKIRRFARYCWSGSFFTRSFDSWMFLQSIEKDREFYMNCESPNFKPYWIRVERDMNHVLYTNGRLTRDDVDEIMRRHEHIFDQAIMDCGDEELIAFFLEGKADVEHIEKESQNEEAGDIQNH